MKVFIDGRDSGPLTHDQWRQARRYLPDREASGRVRSVEEAMRARWRLAWLRGTVLSGIILIIILICIPLSVGGVENRGLALAAAGVAAIFTYAICFILVPLWKVGLDKRYVGLPEQGVPLSAEKSGLKIGETSASWRDVSLQALYLSDDDGEVVLRRLTLSSPFEGVTLDPDLIENGRDIVAYVFQRLCAEPSKETA